MKAIPKLSSHQQTIYVPDMSTSFQVYQTHWRVTQPNWSRPLHEHPMFELNYVLEGHQKVLVGHDKVVMNSGDILLIPPGVPHRVTDSNHQQVVYFALHFDVEDYIFRAMLNQYGCGLHPAGSASESVLREPLGQLLQVIKHDSKDQSQISQRMIFVSRLFTLLAALGTVSEQRGELPQQPQNTSMLGLACKMAKWIEDAIRSDHVQPAYSQRSIARLAEELGYSASYLRKVFHKIFGCSPRQYWSRMMLHTARIELLDPGQTLEGIAAKLGYQDGAHFSKQFKRWTGYSPTEFRLSRQSQET
ncbi:helix-turn-helix domain-containing protein [Paenibacillus senegalensis]|uniref:helix-turn-helix domain-containing protein n=1 Tax=Paenibacillus senegalensis TaxID=1465766 RepID=UPI000287E96C|nr:helix-turn-helix domain-containing protein [Paenibacillus senegalensis]